FFLQFAVNLLGRTVGIFWQQERVPAAVDVGNIDSAIRAEKTVAGLRDQDAIHAADYGPAFAQSEFNDAGIEVVLFRPSDGFGGWGDGREINQLTFGFGED